MSAILKSVLKVLLAVGFIAAGSNHFLNAGFYLRMMPPYLPFPLELIQLSGVAEVLLGVGLLIPPCSAVAAWGIIALLVAVFPANVQMALHPETFPEFSATAIYLRLPVQVVFILWAWWYAGAKKKPQLPASGSV